MVRKRGEFIFFVSVRKGLFVKNYHIIFSTRFRTNCESLLRSIIFIIISKSWIEAFARKSVELHFVEVFFNDYQEIISSKILIPSRLSRLCCIRYLIAKLCPLRYDLINRVTQLLLGFAVPTLIRFGLIRCCDKGRCVRGRSFC